MILLAFKRTGIVLPRGRRRKVHGQVPHATRLNTEASVSAAHSFMRSSSDHTTIGRERKGFSARTSAASGQGNTACIMRPAQVSFFLEMPFGPELNLETPFHKNSHGGAAIS